MRAAGRAVAWSGLDASFRMVIVDERDAHLNRLFRVNAIVNTTFFFWAVHVQRTITTASDRKCYETSKEYQSLRPISATAHHARTLVPCKNGGMPSLRLINYLDGLIRTSPPTEWIDTQKTHATKMKYWNSKHPIALEAVSIRAKPSHRMTLPHVMQSISYTCRCRLRWWWSKRASS